MNRRVNGYELLAGWTTQDTRYVPKIEVSRSGKAANVHLFNEFCCHSRQNALTQAHYVIRQVTVVTDDGSLSFK